uniref:Uncharacterized protein n=1 Tax=Arion vulgaris TaxID=1028688 RepID=A0A0B7BJD4_9EUPU
MNSMHSDSFSNSLVIHTYQLSSLGLVLIHTMLDFFQFYKHIFVDDPVVIKLTIVVRHPNQLLPT